MRIRPGYIAAALLLAFVLTAIGGCSPAAETRKVLRLPISCLSLSARAASRSAVPTPPVLTGVEAIYYNPPVFPAQTTASKCCSLR
jgi:hypothetical protein